MKEVEKGRDFFPVKEVDQRQYCAQLKKVGEVKIVESSLRLIRWKTSHQKQRETEAKYLVLC